jgi:hypothetical protein
MKIFTAAKMNRKGSDISPVYMIIAGLLLFLLASCIIGKGVISAVTSYKNSEKSLDKLSQTVIAMADPASSVKLTLVNMKMEKNTAVYAFNKDADLLEHYTHNNGLAVRIIEKPMECSTDACMCLCKSFSLEDSENKDALIQKYRQVYPNIDTAYSLSCESGIVCYTMTDVTFNSDVRLSLLIADEEYSKMEDIEKSTFVKGGEEYIFRWEGGFSFFRADYNYLQKIPSMNDMQENQVINAQSAYADIYVIADTNTHVISFCFDPYCKLLASVQ